MLAMFGLGAVELLILGLVAAVGLLVVGAVTAIIVSGGNRDPRP